jgi:aarF domain-containing kinase
MFAARSLLVVSAKVTTASVLYSCWNQRRNLYVACDSPVQTPWSQTYFSSGKAVPLQLSVSRTNERNIVYRIIRGCFRFGWIMLKMLPGLVVAPFAFFSSSVNRVWWKYAVWVFVSSGPTAIKFAQWVGTRPDIFPDSAVRALSRLHSVSISEYSLEDTEADLNEAYGDNSWREWLELVNDAKLIGSGAIAHVSRGRFISGPDQGREVAIKIVHRGVREIVEADLDIMKFIAWSASHIPQLSSLDLPGAVNEFGMFIKSQTNLLTEATNIRRFSTLFHGMGSEIRFPDVFLERCTEDVLVESFEPGIPLGDVIRDGSTKLKRRVCDLGIQAFLKMLFIDNFVHGDLHPGNILFQPTNGAGTISELNRTGSCEGRVVLLDCGLIAQLGPRDEENFLDLMHAVITGKSMEVGKLMIERSRSPPDTVYMPDEFCRKVAHLVDSTVTSKNLLFGALEFGAVISQLLSIACQHRVRLETDFVSVACALIVLEGVGKQLDPRRNLLWEAEPYIIKQFLKRAREKLIAR